MSDGAGQSFHVLRRIDRTAAGPVFEAAPATDPDMRVTVWSGEAPNVPIGVHPVFAMPIGRGRNERQPLWVEDRPPGCLLSDISPPLPLYDAARIVSQVAEGLVALHKRGHAHGSVSESRIVLDRDGSPVLIGAGVVSGSPGHDLSSVIGLFGRLAPEVTLVEVESMSDFAANLRELALNADRSEACPIPESTSNEHGPRDEATTILLALEPLGFTDEVQVDLGPDESERGLLDRWSNTQSLDDLTGDQTESISTTELAAQARRLLLQRVRDLYATPDLADRFAANEGTACAPIRAQIADEPLDALPIPEGVPYLPDGARNEAESTAEVTAEAPGLFDPIRAEETTGWTGPVETTSPGGLSTRWEWAIAGALVTLLVLAVAATVIFFVIV
jgi:hypothetical protein